MDERLTEAVTARKQMQALVASEGWKSVVAHWQENCSNSATNLIQTPLETLEATGKQEFQKGMIMGIRFCLQFPDALIKDCDNVIEALREPAKKKEEAA